MEEIRMIEFPDCDLCMKKTPAAYDGKTIMGPWAYMCEDHFTTHGKGLGVGRGQRIVLIGKDQLS